MRADAPLLELCGARVVRNGATILDIGSLSFRADEHVAILGPNGSGKSTLIGLLTRDVRPLASDPWPVRFMGEDRWDLLEARSYLGVVTFDLQETYDLPVTAEEATLSGFFGSIGLRPHHHVTAAMRERAREALEDLGVAHLAERTVCTLSTGEARRVLIARALVHDPDVLVLDEPCSGLDPAAAYHVRAAIESLARSGRSVVLVTHHVDDIVPSISRVVMLREGRVFRDGPTSELLTSEVLAGLFGVPAVVEERDGRYRMW